MGNARLRLHAGMMTTESLVPALLREVSNGIEICTPYARLSEMRIMILNRMRAPVLISSLQLAQTVSILRQHGVLMDSRSDGESDICSSPIARAVQHKPQKWTDNVRKGGGRGEPGSFTFGEALSAALANGNNSRGGGNGNRRRRRRKKNRKRGGHDNNSGAFGEGFSETREGESAWGLPATPPWTNGNAIGDVTAWALQLDDTQRRPHYRRAVRALFCTLY